MSNAIVVDESATAAAVTRENLDLSLQEIISRNSAAASMMTRAVRVQVFTWACSYCPNTLELQSITSMMAGHHARMAGWTYRGASTICPGCDLL
ncbi:hypothetical protein [Tessaracoccus sp.]